LAIWPLKPARTAAAQVDLAVAGKAAAHCHLLARRNDQRAAVVEAAVDVAAATDAPDC
jgi:hypothetical protein